jgi:hypothetical protein
MISQDYFDEVVTENADLFDLDAEAAVQESLHQLQITDARKSEYLYLSLTHPESDIGMNERHMRRELSTVLERIASIDESHHRLTLLQHVLDQWHQDPPVVRSLYMYQQGFAKYVEVWNMWNAEHWSDSQIVEEVQVLLNTWLSLIDGDWILLRKLQDTIPQGMHALLSFYSWLVSSDNNPNETLLNNLLSVIYHTCRKCESNKKLWMEETLDKDACLVDLLLVTLARWNSLADSVARVIAVVCTFDDFRTAADLGTTVSSAHAHVYRLAKAGAIPQLYQALVQHSSPPIVLALRSMAIQDESVQSMASLGILDKARELLSESTVTTTNEAERKTRTDMATAVVGLLRNLCANDAIKCRLCVGDASVVPMLHEAVTLYPHESSLQEHYCAVVAAMALREPQNATCLVQYEAPTCIVAAMEGHPHKGTLQRQAALAIRNLVSRSPELRPLVLQQANVEYALKSIAAQHKTCQDEVYAALRDLGVSAQLMTCQQDEHGNVTLRGTQLFGERNTNFRPDFEPSTTNV